MLYTYPSLIKNFHWKEPVFNFVLQQKSKKVNKCQSQKSKSNKSNQKVSESQKSQFAQIRPCFDFFSDLFCQLFESFFGGGTFFWTFFSDFCIFNLFSSG